MLYIYIKNNVYKKLLTIQNLLNITIIYYVTILLPTNTLHYIYNYTNLFNLNIIKYINYLHVYICIVYLYVIIYA